MEFSELDLHPDLRRGLDEAGYVTAMPVQEQVLPHAFLGKDIYAQSQTGTGKTAAFLIGILQRIMTIPEQRARKVLILAPTRELAVQIHGECEKLGKYLDISAGAFFGGVSYGPQVDMLRNNVQMIIGTPGRIIDLVQQGKMLLKEVGFLVIDEADRMFDMGFIDDIRKLLRYLPPVHQRQTFLFSATLGLRVKDLAWEYMVDPVEIAIEPESVTVDLVTQELYHVGSHEKLPLLLGILERDKPESAIIFCNQKFMTEELARRLKINGFDCEYIMGDLPQSKRLEIIEDLKAGKLHFLVATDVAARGLDIEALDMVFNYDIPEDAESYVHRIGRTARAGKAGKAVTLACEKFVYGLPAIEKYIGNKIPVFPVTQDLLIEDRSRGMHYGHSRTDSKGGRGYPGSGSRSGSRPEGRGDSRGDPRRRGENRPRQAPRPETTRPETSRPEGGRPEGNRSQAQRPQATPRSGDPYSLPQDERMKRYKEKYADGRPAPAGQSGQSGQGRGQGRGQGGRGGQAQRPDSRDRGRAPRTGRDGGSRDSGSRSGGRGNGGQRQGQQSNGRTAPQQAQPAKKPGILDRIKGIFGNKKSKN